MNNFDVYKSMFESVEKREFVVKEGIHPKYYEAKVSCVTCNTVYEVGSTVESMTTEVCGNCHPFYTGKYRLVDSTGRVEKFNKKYAKFLATPSNDTTDQGSSSEDK